MGRWMDGWKDGRTGGLTDRRMDGQTNGQTDRQINRQVDKQIDRQVDRRIGRQVGRQTNQTDGHIGRQADKQTDRRLGEQMDYDGQIINISEHLTALTGSPLHANGLYGRTFASRHYQLQITVQWIHVLSNRPRNFLTQFPCPSVRNIRSVKCMTGANCRESIPPGSHLSKRMKYCCVLGGEAVDYCSKWRHSYSL